MKKSPYFGKGVLVSCISQFIHSIKSIRENSLNRPKSHKLENLVLIVEAKKMIWRNSGVRNVYTFSHAYFEGVEFFAARRYVHLTKE